MQIRLMSIIFNLINIAILISIVAGVIIGAKELKKFINRNKEMDKKLDIILKQLENKDNEQ